MDEMLKLIEFTKKLKLLYVEDNEDSRESTCAVLEEFFEHITIATNGQEGLEHFNKTNFDLIITDINMPVLNGLDMIKEIKQINQSIPIMVISAHNESKYFLDSIKLGVDGYLIKPLDIEHFVTSLEKITQKLKVEEQLENQRILSQQYQDAIDSTTIVSKTNPLGIITYVNENFCNISQYKQEELIGFNHNIVRHPDTKKETFEEMWKTIAQKKQEWMGIIKNKKKDGEAYYVNTTIKPILDKDENIIEFLSLRHDISSVMSDKKHFLDRIRQNSLSILILIQIDEYEMLEKFYNPSLIDKLEKIFSYKILSYLPDSYKFQSVYNLDNGRYALISEFYNFSQRNIIIEDYLNDFVKNIKDSIIEVDSIEYDLNITLSYTMGKHMLYEDAKAGLEEAINKNIPLQKSNDISILYQNEAKKNLNTIKMLKIALDNHNVVSYFQPIINNKTKEIEKYESLVRIIDENGKILTPYHFLSVSKKGAYYNKITLRVLENSFKILSKVKSSLSINLSTLDIEKIETREKIFKLLDEYKQDRHRLVFELLEDEDSKDFMVIKNFIKEVKSLGVSIAIDDFGAGYSNFERLLEFNPDILKIDGSLIKDIEDNPFSLSVVKTIVAFAKEQKIKTIAEFVENERIFNILKDLDVDYSQGYYFGKPQPLNDDLKKENYV